MDSDGGDKCGEAGLLGLFIIISFFFFFFNDTATTEIYTLSLHDALPICGGDIVRDQRLLGTVRGTIGDGPTR